MTDTAPFLPDAGNGLSAYEVWLAAGNTGDVNDYLASLVGPPGPAGAAGAAGATGPPGPGGTLVTLAADVVNNNGVANTLADVTGLVIPVVSGVGLKFKFFCTYTTNLVTTGARFTITGPTVTTLQWMLTQNGGTQNIGAPVLWTTYGEPSSPTASALTTNFAILEGVILPSASGDLQLRFSSEVASAAVTAKAKLSFAEYRSI